MRNLDKLARTYRGTSSIPPKLRLSFIEEMFSQTTESKTRFVFGATAYISPVPPSAYATTVSYHLSLRANKMVPLRPVTVCYSSASLALLQFVTNTLLAERIPGIRIQTALTRHEELEVRNEKDDQLITGMSTYFVQVN